MSSRNARLGPAERGAASVLFRALSAAQAAFEAGETDAAALRDLMRFVLSREPQADVEYVSVADPLSLVELSTASPGAVVSMAVNIGSVRLIDNLLLPKPEAEASLVAASSSESD
jgi:pantoate--beta-alanine ligase